MITELNTVHRFQMRPRGKDLLMQRQQMYPPDYFYKPISLNITGSDFCPVGCAGCGIDSVRKRKEASSLPQDLRIGILEEAYDLGYVSYLGSVGDGEPFLSLEFFAELIQRFKGRLDLTKINTSCVTFSTIQSATNQLKFLAKHGWTDTTYFKPVLSLSVGMQQEAGVPLQNIINGILAFRNVFNPEQAVLGISHYQTPERYGDALKQLRYDYEQQTGRKLEESAVVKSALIQEAGRAQNMEQTNFTHRPINAFSNFKCHNLTLTEFLEPATTITQQGDIYMCVAFDRQSRTLGNITSVSLSDAVTEANGRPFYRLVSQLGQQEVRKIVECYEPEIGMQMVVDRHHACAKLHEILDNHPEAYEEHLK